MNSYFKITKKLKDLVQEDVSVATVVHGKTSESDLYKTNLFPLIHINPIGRDYSSPGLNIYKFELAALDKRQISKHNQIEDKFYGNDNELDNLTTTDAILNRLITKLSLQVNEDDDIMILGMTDAFPVLLGKSNLLDGWVITITLQIGNGTISIC